MKLVRDNIIEIIKNQGKTPIFHTADKEEFKRELSKKLIEEAEEFREEPGGEELGDVLEVIDEIIDFYGFSKKSILEEKEKKAEKRGKFKKRIILDSF